MVHNKHSSIYERRERKNNSKAARIFKIKNQNNSFKSAKTRVRNYSGKYVANGVRHGGYTLQSTHCNLPNAANFNIVPHVVMILIHKIIFIITS